MNPESNKFEPLIEQQKEPTADELEKALRRLNPLRDKLAAMTATKPGQLVRPNGEPVPAHWSIFRVGDAVVVNGYTFRVDYIGEQVLLLVPVGPVLVGQQAATPKGE